jgi:hypothetical protein
MIKPIKPKKPRIWCVKAKFRLRISVDRARKALHIFCIDEIHYSRYMLTSIGNLGLIGCGSLDRLYLILLSDHQLTATDTLCSGSREKNTIENAIRSREWPFKLNDNAFTCAFSQKPGRLLCKIFSSKTTGFVLDMLLQ